MTNEERYAPFPVIRVELEGLKQTMVHAFSTQCLQMDELFQKAISECLNPERLQELLNRTAAQCLAERVEAETKAFFNYGDGRKMVATIMLDHLHREFPSTQPTKEDEALGNENSDYTTSG